MPLLTLLSIKKRKREELSTKSEESNPSYGSEKEDFLTISIRHEN